MELRLARNRRSDLPWAVLFLAPNLAGFLIFVAMPVAFSLAMAFTNWDLIKRAPFEFVGIENFKRMFLGPEAREFRKFFINTLYLMLELPVSVCGSLLLAVLLHDPLNLGSRRVRIAVTCCCLAMTALGVLLCLASGRHALGLILAIGGATAVITFTFNRVGLRTLCYLPFFTVGVAQFILWKLMFRPDAGPINATLRVIFSYLHLDLEPPGWLGSTANLFSLSPQTGLPEAGHFGLGARDAIVLMGIWATVGGNNMLLYLAGLSNIPNDLYEAAMIDGAGRWRAFWNVSWPQLAPTTFFIVIMSVIGGLQGGFEQARVMTEGRPADTTVTLGYYIFNEGFNEFRLGYASAIAWVMFLMIFVATLLNWRFGSRQLNV